MLTATDKQNIKEGSTEIGWNEKNKYNKLNVKYVFRAKKWRQSADRGFVTGFYNIYGERVCNIHLYLIEMKQRELGIFIVMWDGSSQTELKMIFQNNYLGKDWGVLCQQAERDRHVKSCTRSDCHTELVLENDNSHVMTTVMLC